MSYLPKSSADGSATAQSEGTFDKALIDRIIFGRWWIPATYHVAILAIVLLFAVQHWVVRLERQRYVSEPEKGQGMASDRSPLLKSPDFRPPRRRGPRFAGLQLRLRAALTYQPSPKAGQDLPCVATIVSVSSLLGVNFFYLNYYTGSTLPVWTACILDRSGLLFVANLPWLYLLSAKNQPLHLLTGHSYESLNILHRGLGKWMSALAVFHVMGFFAFWWYYARPVSADPLATLIEWLLQRFVLFGVGAFVCYQVLAATSTPAFRQWWYECFLASHIVLQAAGLVLLFFHHPNARIETGVALAIFFVDRAVYRAGIKSTVLPASLEILEDGETVLMSAHWPLSHQPSMWKHLLGKDVKQGWKPMEHVFISVPSLGRRHSLQAHPFTIASAAPENGQEHAWLSLIIRARDGFTKDLLHHARLNHSVQARFDGPYGSQNALELLQHSDAAIFVAGGSGIAVAYPIVWSLLHHASRNRERARVGQVSLIWIVRETTHLSWIGMERLDELKELGLHLILPEPTIEAGRPDVGHLLEDAMEYALRRTCGCKAGVVVSGPDAMNLDVNNVCARLAWEGRDVEVVVEKFGW